MNLLSNIGHNMEHDDMTKLPFYSKFTGTHDIKRQYHAKEYILIYWMDIYYALRSDRTVVLPNILI